MTCPMTLCLEPQFDTVCITVYNTVFKTQCVINLCQTSAEFATVPYSASTTETLGLHALCILFTANRMSRFKDKLARR